MNNVYLSKSKYCKCVQCEKILWLSKYKPKCTVVEDNESLFETGRQVGELAKGLFGDYEDVKYNEDYQVMVKKTEELLQNKPNIITEASFDYDNNSCRVDILKNDPDGVEIYEVKSSTKVKEIYLDDVSYQYFVLSNLGLTVKKACIIHINNEYIRGKKLDIKQLFKIEDLTSMVKQKQSEIKTNIDFINRFMDEHDADYEPIKELGEYCFEPYSCDFWEHCTKDLPKPNVFDIQGGMQKRTKLKNYNKGLISFEDLANAKINKKSLEQIDFELNNREPKIETEEIIKFLDSLTYPLYFIDYESCNYAIPEFEGTKPYQQIPFQYSLHIIKKPDAPLEHKEFLAKTDDKNLIRTFAESMIKDLPENGSVVVYNKTFEAGVNKKIGEMYPDLKEETDRINNNIVDLMVPFRKRHYYSKEMKGSYSIKMVLPALYPDNDELDYGKLKLIHKGDEASDAFRKLKNQTLEEQKRTREGLLEYCKLDTLAMVKIWEKFKEVTE